MPGSVKPGTHLAGVGLSTRSVSRKFIVSGLRPRLQMLNTGSQRLGLGLSTASL